MKRILKALFNASDKGAFRPIASIPFLLFLYYFPPIKEVLHNIFIGNIFFLRDWYDTNHYGTAIIWEFFTNKAVFNALVVLVIFTILLFVISLYLFYILVWCTFFPRYVIRQAGIDRPDGRIYWSNRGLSAGLGRRLRAYCGAAEPEPGLIYWVNMRGLINPIFPWRSLTKIKHSSDTEHFSIWGRHIVREDGIRVRAKSRDIDVLICISGGLPMDNIDNNKLDGIVEESLKNLIYTAGESVHGDTVVNKKLILDTAIVIPRGIKEELDLVERERERGA